MSLLMDALKKAEEAKRLSEASAGNAPPADGTAADAAPAATPLGENGLPDLSTNLELVDLELQAHAQDAPSAQPAQPGRRAQPAPARDDPAQARQRAAAQNVFQAKQPRPSRAFPVAVGAATLLAVAAIGGYFWWQLQPKAGVMLAGGATRPAPAPVPAAGGAIAPPASPAAAPGSAVAPAPAPPPGAPSAAAAGPALAPTRAEAPRAAAPQAPPIRISTGKAQINPALTRAYQALSADNLAAARTDYESVLRSDARNLDALHGLAAISLRQERAGEAEAFYLRILEADPKDAAALAALVGLKGAADPVQAETRLKTLLAGQPGAPSLHFALGNLYAAQGRWNDAQQSYFRAYAGDSENPDYLFNLAVSLEQLRQPKLAVQYYQAALAALAHRPAGFDKDVATGRLSELQQ